MDKKEVRNLVGGLLTAAVVSRVSRFRSGGGMMTSVIGLGAAALARRSLPGALIVGGALLAKEIMDQRMENEAAKAKAAKPASKTSSRAAQSAKPALPAKSRAPRPTPPAAIATRKQGG